jgi:response regulator RpfG family c-di-GMP phosphodiesterase
MKYPHLQSEEAMLTSDELSRHEKQTVLNHARLGGEAVAALKKCPIGSDQLIKQHHGMSTGIGFATEYKDDISPMAKVIIIAEAFVEEFIIFRESHGNSSIDMVEFIQKLNDKFKKNSYKKIIETLLTIRL